VRDWPVSLSVSLFLPVADPGAVIRRHPGGQSPNRFVPLPSDS
jgi:hypothetical protein